MYIDKNAFFDLTYCTNIHSGETWSEVLDDLKKYILPLKSQLAPNKPFAIGLRLSRYATDELINNTKAISYFKQWLKENQLYVMTINGFPYGVFHNKCIKDKAYAPDWSTVERRDYSLQVIKVLEALMPTDSESGFSTSPLSYKPWLNAETTQSTFYQSSLYLMQIVEVMIEIHRKSGKLIHIDIEPEPDCLIETMRELIQFYQNTLVPLGTRYLVEKLMISKSQAEQHIRRHIQVCYDVCHSSVEYEEPIDIFNALEEAGIQIGKIQVSAALKCCSTKDKSAVSNLSQFNDNQYLHQVIVRNRQGTLKHYSDLIPALAEFDKTDVEELRTHFHVPVFLDQYQTLSSTQDDIVKVLKLLQKNKATRHLEIETYTWDVLPAQLKLEIIPSIKREYEWVLQQFSKDTA